MTKLLSVILPVFAIMLAGRVSVRRNWIGEAAVRPLTDLVFYGAMPCLWFDSLVHAERVVLVSSTLLWFGVTLCVYALGMVLARLLLGASFASAAVIGLNACFGNLTMMGIPVIVGAFGTVALTPMLGIVTLAATVVLPLATVLIEIGRAHGGIRAGALLRTMAGRLIRHPVIVVFAVAFAWRRVALPIPEALHTLLRLCGGAAVPLALFCLGASLPASAERGVVREVVLAGVLRLIVSPALVLGVGACLGLSGLPFKVAVLLAGMPTAANAFLLARQTETATQASAATVLVTTAASIISMSVLVALVQ